MDNSVMGPIQKSLRIAFWTALLVAGIACVVWSYSKQRAAEQEMQAQAAGARSDAERIQAQVILFTERAVPARMPFSSVLGSFGIDQTDSARIVASAEPVFNLRHLRAGNKVAVGRSVLGQLRAVRYAIDPDRDLIIRPEGDSFHSEIETIPSQTDTVGIAGEIEGSLFEAVVGAGEKPELAMRIAEIFAYDLDFYTDPRPGDTFRVVVEKRMLSYGRILAAEYNCGRRSYSAVLFHDPSGNPAYYTVAGKSMKKEFLHSPLKFAAVITSHFSEHRFHPILKEYRPHLGIDYAAPTGTPVQTIGDGRVKFAGPKGGAGNLIEIQHSNGYTTYYMHLSRIMVHTGERVEQGERIGLVGMTGLATGPHLDFRIERKGQFLNFERLPLPPSDPVSKRDWTKFTETRDKALAFMPELPANQPAPSVARNIPAAPDATAR